MSEQLPPPAPSPVPAISFHRRRGPWLNILLFLATGASTIYAGAILGRAGLFGSDLPPLLSGFLFAATLLLILGSHELGHYFVARLHGVEVTLPYFIPVPFGLGTFGAFIQLRAPVQTRRALFDLGLAGPIAGVVVALPLFIVGLLLAPSSFHFGSFYGNGLLVQGLVTLVEKLRGLPVHVHLMAHPISFAAYIGLFITAVNLLPAGQLDGGHVAYALFGRRSYGLALASFFGLLILGKISGWSAWFVWAFLILLLGLRHPPPVDDGQPLDWPRYLVGGGAAALLLLLFASRPFAM